MILLYLFMVYFCDCRCIDWSVDIDRNARWIASFFLFERLLIFYNDGLFFRAWALQFKAVVNCPRSPFYLKNEKCLFHPSRLMKIL